MIASDSTELVVFGVLGFSVVMAMLAMTQDLVPSALQWSRQHVQRTRALGQAAGVRLGRMLKFRNIREADFGRHLAVNELESAVRNCHSCTSQSRCEAVLRGHLETTDLSFCPNASAFDRVIAINKGTDSSASAR
ncbi:hypothetical protein E4T66_06050 [Sinimarinibacterium sp. CAU 1509]|uniref:DUF6455 family protein n=1 Tax=Sinimarinibacterium sp. CAU 1509 TaxID=2562283 RepID=UPI0010ACF8DB|nr:DUF6455 family protein [Sinimarinibacterium sp. CAU 1509]TJY63259.1 hypothetical protein E4T66_06050 [Sinimarinibacterium sp. CAU 1509]